MTAGRGGVVMYMIHASTTPAATTTTDRISNMYADVPPGPASWTAGKTGSKKCENRVPLSDGTPTAQPAATARSASTISGHVMTGGDSCTWWATSRDILGPLKKARNSSRNV